MTSYGSSSRPDTLAAAATIVFAVPLSLFSTFLYMHAYNALASYWHWTAASFWQVFAVEVLVCTRVVGRKDESTGWDLFWHMAIRNVAAPAIVWGAFAACIAIWG